MAPHVRSVEVARTLPLAAYRAVDHLDAEVDACQRLGARVASLLGTRRVWMLSSTEHGGGVAEMLPRECGLLADVGVDVRWLVLEPETPAFFRATKSLHNMIHGRRSDVPLAELGAVYEQTSRAAVASLHAHIERDDILVVHDPQPVALAALVAEEKHPLRIWRCHIGLTRSNEETDAAWAFLARWLAPYERLLFSLDRYIPPTLQPRSGVLHPGIDPLSHKNRELRPYKLIGVLRSAGLVSGPEVPAWARFSAPALRYTDDGWRSSPIDTLLHSPVILQVSRFDRLKGFQLLMPAFTELVSSGRDRAAHVKLGTARVADELERVLLVLCGPDPMGVADDPEAQTVLDALCRQRDALPQGVRERVHIVRLPMVSVKENALTVNALQRLASVVAQVSLEEGFGLTVTEALWKCTPLVASDVGGISLQVRPATDGVLVPAGTGHDELARALFDQLFRQDRGRTMCAAGRRRVAEHFLLLAQVRRWLEEIELVMGVAGQP